MFVDLQAAAEQVSEGGFSARCLTRLPGVITERYRGMPATLPRPRAGAVEQADEPVVVGDPLLVPLLGPTQALRLSPDGGCRAGLQRLEFLHVGSTAVLEVGKREVAPRLGHLQTGKGTRRRRAWDGPQVGIWDRDVARSGGSTVRVRLAGGELDHAVDLFPDRGLGVELLILGQGVGGG